MRRWLKGLWDVYFSGDQISVFVHELLLRDRLPRNVFGLLSLRWATEGERQVEGVRLTGGESAQRF